MYYILSKKYQKNGAPCFNQLGIVIADSIEQAAEKVGLPITQSHALPNSPTSWAEMDNNYHLDLIPEWDGTFPEEESNGPVNVEDNLFDRAMVEYTHRGPHARQL